MTQKVVVLPGDNIKEVVLDPVTGRVIVEFIDGSRVVIKDEKIVLVRNNTKATFESFQEFCDFVHKHTAIRIVTGGKDEA